MSTSGMVGSGPGVITPDGCAVDLYTLLPPGPDPQIVHDAIPAGATILELGCGAGRMTGPLIVLGHPVVAVDESPEMLALVHDGETVRGRIQDLRLGRRFDVVLLASHLINVDDATRLAFLQTCRQHVAERGYVIIQQHAPGWFACAAESESTDGRITYGLRDVSRPDPGLLSATVEYVVGDRRWTHSFTTVELPEDRLHADLGAARLELSAYLTPDRSWLRAVPWRDSAH